MPRPFRGSVFLLTFAEPEDELDGIGVIRTSEARERLSAEDTARRYNNKLCRHPPGKPLTAAGMGVRLF